MCIGILTSEEPWVYTHGRAVGRVGGQGTWEAKRAGARASANQRTGGRANLPKPPIAHSNLFQYKCHACPGSYRPWGCKGSEEATARGNPSFSKLGEPKVNYSQPKVSYSQTNPMQMETRSKQMEAFRINPKPGEKIHSP